jgi:hypothetical protein
MTRMESADSNSHVPFFLALDRWLAILERLPDLGRQASSPVRSASYSSFSGTPGVNGRFKYSGSGASGATGSQG